ncbi:Trp biosynthesis-associated membrane protein [Leifsonia sp. ALI-44-B]|uniref:Trp biosynthesis-associated membrane protein n=1 Tax=Leifsonia sp. ALI-44-B TaxID=1933776 RepID=UPI0009FAA535|nr:Trp biosynthesis-associated membrane protein [Leifsonia sp. ALI-44-B]
MTSETPGPDDVTPAATDAAATDADERLERATARAKRVKYLSLLGLVVLSALSLLAWTQTWFSAQLSQTQNSPVVGIIEVSGEVAAPALSALALAGLALTAALAIAGVLFRYILAVLNILLGVCISLSAFLALQDGVRASEPAVTQVTGIAGHESVRTIVSSAIPTAWPIVTLILGIGFVLVGALVLATARRWPSSSKRYRTVAVNTADAATDGASTADGPSADLGSREPGSHGHSAAAASSTGAPVSTDGTTPEAPAAADGTPRMDPVDSWDELTRGDDPTR